MAVISGGRRAALTVPSGNTIGRSSSRAVMSSIATRLLAAKSSSTTSCCRNLTISKSSYESKTKEAAFKTKRQIPQLKDIIVSWRLGGGGGGGCVNRPSDVHYRVMEGNISKSRVTVATSKNIGAMRISSADRKPIEIQLFGREICGQARNKLSLQRFL